MRIFWTWFVRVPSAAIAVWFVLVARAEAIAPALAYMAALLFAFIAFRAGRNAMRIREVEKAEEAMAPGTFWRRMQDTDAA